jgi:tetratricopeptide (TPR) repeat protein
MRLKTGPITLLFATLFVSLAYSISHGQEPKSTATITDVESARAALRAGQYAECIEYAKAQVDKKVWNDKWPILLVEAYLTTGKYEQALVVYEESLSRFGDSLRLRLLGVDVYRMNNQPLKSKEQLDVIDRRLNRDTWLYSVSSEFVNIGDYFLLRNEDPKLVLKNCYDLAVKADPKSPDPHLATARMALDKSDSKVAAQSLAKALKLDDKNPETHYLSAKAWQSTEPDRATDHLQKSLALNPKYVPSLLLVVEQKMNEEQYAKALQLLDEVEKVNPRLPKLWALRAAIAHLEGRYDAEGEARKKALSPWSLNPEVDHTIGRHLSMHYRFTESVEYQKRALTMDSSYVSAQSQLAQDLLRLGQTDPGWDMVDRVRKNDPYDVTIFNLRQLQKELDRFATLEAPGFVIRMDARESRIYGRDVVQILSEARDVLTSKYKVQLEEPIYVEIFPKQKDFAIRTFGMPGGQGFLGVCFGRLITANSPAALQVDSNWKSVLWHEYCHVITLQKTKNKMPRWLSEGISVYEERLRDKTWGQAWDPTYREMTLGEDFVPLSKLSGAFLNPKTPMHLQYAYFESSLAVEFYVEKFGLPALLRMLDDLSLGLPAADALKRSPGSLEALDNEFAAFAKERAEGMAPQADWSKPPVPEKTKEAIGLGIGLGSEGSEIDPAANASANDWFSKNPGAFVSLEKSLQQAVGNSKWTDALAIAEKMRTQWPDDARTTGVYAKLAMIHQRLEQIDQEREALVSLVERSSDAFDALSRLCELDETRKDWESLAKWSERLHAIQPIRFDVQQRRAMSHELIGKHATASDAWLACLELDPLDYAWMHYKAAENLKYTGRDSDAKRQVLMALEESPRFSDALRLLLQLQKGAIAENKPSEKSERPKPPQRSAPSERPVPPVLELPELPK